MNKYVVLYLAFVISHNIYGQTGINKLSLNEAIELGLKNNPEVKTSYSKIKAADGRFWSGISLPMPELSTNYEYIPKHSSLSKYEEKTVGVSQTIEFPSNYFLRGSKLTTEKAILVNEHSIVQLNVVAKIKAAYFSLLQTLEQLKITEENFSITDDFYKKAVIRYDLGEGTNLEQLTAKVQRTEALNNLEIEKNKLLTVRADLNFALGFGKGEVKEFTLSDSLEFRSYNIRYEEIVEEAETQNSQLKINELNVKSSSQDITLAWSSMLPNINIAYSKQTRDGNKNFYGASFGISLPIWSMFDSRGKIEEAYANNSAAETELHSARNSVYLSIKKAFTEFNNEEKQVQLYKTEILPQADEIYRIALKSYEAGEATYLEFLQAKQILINAKSNYINILLAYNLSLISLEQAVGKRIL